MKQTEDEFTNVKGKVNTFLLDRMERLMSEGQLYPFILQTSSEGLDSVTSLLANIGLSYSPPIDIPKINEAFIPLVSQVKPIGEIIQSEYVKKLHYDMPKTILDSQQIRKLTDILLPTISDPLLGTFSLDHISAPEVNPLNHPILLSNVYGLPGEIFSIPQSILYNLPSPPPIKSPKVDKIVPTGDVYNRLNMPYDNNVVNTKVGVLDTGLVNPSHPLWSKNVNARAFTGETPNDFQGHGSWCMTAAFGGQADTPYGMCKGMANAKGDNVYIGKVLSNIGMGSTQSVLRGMKWMIENDVDVVSMSLGGDLQGPVQEDPECQIIQKTSDRMDWIIAAGNSGKDKWTIGSPGASPDALTVGAYSFMTNQPADFSSRGPNGKFYKDNEDIFSRDVEKYGDRLNKPDLGVYGGGPTGDNPRDDLYSGTQGLADTSGDLIPNNYCPMRGTSMATPITAGMVSLALDRGYIDDVAEIKKRMARKAKEIDRGYGLLTWDVLRE